MNTKDSDNNSLPAHHRDDVYQLSTPEEHQRYYDAWAKTYDADFVEHHGYAYPERVARLFMEIAQSNDRPIADIGCGTGLIGQHLRHLGQKSTIDGFDISQGMLDMAAKKQHYDGLFLADITAPLPGNYQNHYGGLISTGTFTLGHLGPDALGHALTMARKDALALIGINAMHFEEKGFDQAFQHWQDHGMIKKLEWHEVAIYFDDAAADTENTTAWVAEFRINTESDG